MAHTDQTKNNAAEPKGALMMRIVAMPADANPDGDIFGGWLLGLMDMSGSLAARGLAGRRVVTIAVDSMAFLKPVFVGDVVCCYADPIRVGSSSATFAIQAWVLRSEGGERELVTEGRFTFVSIGADRRPRPLKNPPVMAS